MADSTFTNEIMRPLRNFNDDGSPISGVKTCEVIKEVSGDTCLLAFSAGKDSFAAWLRLREHFKTIIPFYMYRIPGMVYIQDILKMYEDFFQTEILQVPSVDVFQMTANYVWQPAHRCQIIEAVGMITPGYDDITAQIRRAYDIPDNVFVATGVRAVDNIERGMAARKHGSINWNRQSFWPIWDMKKADLIEHIKKHKGMLSKEYIWFGHSIGGMDYRFIRPIKDNSPKDWDAITKMWPLAWTELVRYEHLQPRSAYPKPDTPRPIPPMTQKAKIGYIPTPRETKLQKNEPDPLKDVVYTGDFCHDTLSEFLAIRHAMEELDKRDFTDPNRFYETIDLPYGFPIVFQSRKTKYQFLIAMGWMEHGDVFFDGLELADLLNLDLKTGQFAQTTARVNKFKGTALLDKSSSNPLKAERVPEPDPEAEGKPVFVEETGFKTRMVNDQDRFDTAVKTAFYAWFSFRTQEQATAFARAMGWTLHTFEGQIYVDGPEVAALYGIMIDDEKLPNKKTKRNPALLELVKE